MTNRLPKKENKDATEQSLPNVIARAEPTLPRLLKTLDTDPTKMVSVFFYFHSYMEYSECIVIRKKIDFEILCFL